MGKGDEEPELKENYTKKKGKVERLRD